MKKVILLVILFISLIGNINAQTDSTKVELTKETIYKDVKHALTQLGDALKVGTEHVYGVLVKQQIVNSITRIIIYIIFFLAASLLLYNGNRLLRIKEEKGRSVVDEDLINWNMAPGIIIGLSLLVYFFFTISSTIGGFVNPEYGAIMKIMELIK